MKYLTPANHLFSVLTVRCIFVTWIQIPSHLQYFLCNSSIWYKWFFIKLSTTIANHSLIIKIYLAFVSGGVGRPDPWRKISNKYWYRYNALKSSYFTDLTRISLLSKKNVLLFFEEFSLIFFFRCLGDCRGVWFPSGCILELPLFINCFLFWKMK